MSSYLCRKFSTLNSALSSQFYLPSLDEQVTLAEYHDLSSLLFCPGIWASQHRFINQKTDGVMHTGIIVGLASIGDLVRLTSGGNWSKLLDQRCFSFQVLVGVRHILRNSLRYLPHKRFHNYRASKSCPRTFEVHHYQPCYGYIFACAFIYAMYSMDDLDDFFGD